MTIKDLFTLYKPRDEFKILAFQSKITYRFVAVIYKKTPIYTKFGKEIYEGSLKNISEADIEKYLNELKPYIIRRAEHPLIPSECYESNPDSTPNNDLPNV